LQKRKQIRRKRKHYEEKEWKYVYRNEEKFVSDLRKDNPSNFAIIYRYYRKDNKDISRIKKCLEHQKG